MCTEMLYSLYLYVHLCIQNQYWIFTLNKHIHINWVFNPSAGRYHCKQMNCCAKEFSPANIKTLCNSFTSSTRLIGSITVAKISFSKCIIADKLFLDVRLKVIKSKNCQINATLKPIEKREQTHLSFRKTAISNTCLSFVVEWNEKVLYQFAFKKNVTVFFKNKTKKTI